MNHDHSSHEHRDDTEGKISRSKLVTIGFLLVIGYFLWTEHRAHVIQILPWLSAKFLGIDFLSHDAGHLPEMIFGWRGNPHLGPFHLASDILIFGGFIMLSSAWRVLYKAQQEHRLATTGLYARMRRPQYVAFILIMLGFLLQWPTILTLAMFPILVWMYVRLAKAEEQDALAEFGQEYEAYRQRTPGFIPHFGGGDMPRTRPH